MNERFLWFLAQDKQMQIVKVIAVKMLQETIAVAIFSQEWQHPMNWIRMSKNHKQVDFSIPTKTNGGITINTKVLLNWIITSSFDLEFDTSVPFTTMKLFLVSINWLFKNSIQWSLIWNTWMVSI